MVFFAVSANDAHELESELAAAHQAIENLVKEAAASESRANALSENAWRWVFRYRRIQRALRRLTGRTNNVPSTSTAQTNGASSVAHSGDTLTKLLALAKSEARHGRNNAATAIAQLIGIHYPQSPLPKSLSVLEPNTNRTPSQNANYHLALAQAHYLLGENEAAASNYRTALTFNSDLPDAHSGLAALNLPGIGYLDWLEKLYGFLKPKNVIEIGVSQSASLARVPAPAIAIGVDPVPSVIYPLQTEAHIFAETSDDFFARRYVRELLRGEPLSIGFIDGSHLFEQALRDFMNLEKYCGPNSLIMFHDTVPLDELTQRREPETHFSTGDVWKTILCLKQYRSDLEIFTIATPPTGLTLVLGLDPSSDVLTKNYEHAVARFIDRGFPEVEHKLASELNIVPNDWNVVETRLNRITKH